MRRAWSVLEPLPCVVVRGYSSSLCSRFQHACADWLSKIINDIQALKVLRLIIQLKPATKKGLHGVLFSHGPVTMRMLKLQWSCSSMSPAVGIFVICEHLCSRSRCSSFDSCSANVQQHSPVQVFIMSSVPKIDFAIVAVMNHYEVTDLSEWEQIYFSLGLLLLRSHKPALNWSPS